MEEKKVRVLVVDDSPSSLRVTCDALRAAGFDVHAATEGEEAIQLVKQDPPDVVVLDIILPKKTGFQVCREIKSHPQTQCVRVVLLSSKCQEADRFWGQRQGADAYLTKPVDDSELVTIVRAVSTAEKRTTLGDADDARRPASIQDAFTTDRTQVTL